MDWGALVRVTLHLYQQVAKETWEKMWRAWWVGLLPLLYAPLFFLAAFFVAPLGFPGGFILGLVLALCIGSYLYFIAGVINGNRMQLSELADSWRPHFGEVITILFFLFIVNLVLGVFSTPAAGAQASGVITGVLLPIILSPVPEIIYQGRSEGFAMLQESVDFLRESGVEWFVPLVALTLLFAFLSPFSLLALFPSLSFPLSIPVISPQIGYLTLYLLTQVGLGNLGVLTILIGAVLNAFLLYALMVFRGLLFRDLSRGTRRQRIFRSRFE